MTFYSEVVLGTALCAAAIVALFLILVFRRFLAERNQARRDARDGAITRSYLRRVAGHSSETDEVWRRKDRRAAISRILPLLRGGERLRLLQIAELDGVLAETLRVSFSLQRAERINAIQLLQRFGSEVCIGRLREMMARDRSLAVRIEAAFALAANYALPPPRETMRILASLERLPSRMDIALLRSTAPLFPKQMSLLLEDELPDGWRAQVIDALGWTDDPDVVGTLKLHANDADPEIRSAVLRASGRLAFPAAKEWVKNGLNDPVTSVRLQAIAATIRLDMREALPNLRRLCEDEKLWVRLRAEQAVSSFEQRNTEIHKREAHA